MLSQIVSCKPAEKKEPLTNWAGNLTYSTGNVYYPHSVEEVQDVVRQCRKLTTLGSRHSFNRIADNTQNQVSLKNMNRVVSIDTLMHTVTVEGGIKYGELAPYLHQHGYALANLASLPHISVAGACSTGTHGSGVKNGNLSSAVSAIEFVNAAGELDTLSRQKDGDVFNGAVVSLGALGVITKVTLNVIPAFDVKQVVYQNLPMEELKNNFDELQSKGYSVSLFTDWKNKNINEVWIKSRVEKGDVTPAELGLYSAKAATRNLHPVESQPAESATDQMGVPGPWYERLPHFKMGFTPSTGKELQGEYFVPIEHAYEAMMAIQRLSDKISPHLFISEIRTIQADELWMSPCYKRTCVALHTTWKPEWEVVKNLIPQLEAELAPFSPIPHWAKLFTLPASALHARYTKLADFKQLLAKHDPEGKFRNGFLEEYLYQG